MKNHSFHPVIQIDGLHQNGSGHFHATILFDACKPRAARARGMNHLAVFHTYKNNEEWQ